jgi:hypothetical protein
VGAPRPAWRSECAPAAERQSICSFLAGGCFVVATFCLRGLAINGVIRLSYTSSVNHARHRAALPSVGVASLGVVQSSATPGGPARGGVSCGGPCTVDSRESSTEKQSRANRCPPLVLQPPEGCRLSRQTHRCCCSHWPAHDYEVASSFNEAASSFNIGSNETTHVGGPALAHNANASGSGSRKQCVVAKEATLSVGAPLLMSLVGLLWRRQRQVLSAPPMTPCVAPSELGGPPCGAWDAEGSPQAECRGRLPPFVAGLGVSFWQQPRNLLYFD